MSTKVRKYGMVALGGTFDKFHKGHRKLIETALEIGNRILIGVTTKKMLDRNPKTHNVASFKARVNEIVTFLKERQVLDRVTIAPLDDPFGPTLIDENIDVLVVSIKTAFRARDINSLRRKKGWKPLKIMVVTMVLAEDGIPISSNRIRRGEIDREGRLRT